MIRYILFRFFQDLVLVYPVYVILFRESGLDYLQVSWLLAIWSVPVILLEVPSGMIADRWSRKWSLVIGMALKGTGFLVWHIRPDFPGFALGFIFWGLQEAINTGTTEALLYDALKSRNREARFVEIAGWGAAAARGAILLSLLGGGLLFAHSPSAVMLLSSLAMAAAALCAATLPEERSCLASPDKPPFSLKEEVSLAMAIPGLIKFVLYGSLATVVWGVLDEYDFLFGHTLGVPLAAIGLWGGTRFFLEALGSGLAAPLQRRFRLDNPLRLAWWIALAAAALWMGVITGHRLLLPLYFGFYLMMAAAEVIYQGWIQERISSEGRATVSSLVSLIAEVLGLVLLLAAGPVSQGWGLKALFMGGSLVIVVATALFTALWRRARP
ncbi:Major Facilitator Superfamily protein [Alkalispirochaeta americana]|uniref:Major Facilitator Superfamily protein n=1 Tax=Alkalispirochaeta americana TaxID=159291 RepID=A0A1N6N6K9_9SPIO|nr:MFS transporter [Alkalispirochaeta americana]SIP87686.1 Major Facilitator Superfamily protein [Alkalispirochaeta americana]